MHLARHVLQVLVVFRGKHRLAALPMINDLLVLSRKTLFLVNSELAVMAQGRGHSFVHECNIFCVSRGSVLVRQ